MRARFRRAEHCVPACIAAAFSAVALGGILMHLAISSASGGSGWLTAAALAAIAAGAASVAGARRQYEKSSPQSATPDTRKPGGAAFLCGTPSANEAPAEAPKKTTDQIKTLRELIFFGAAGRKLGHETNNFVNNIHMALHSLKNETMSKRGDHVLKLLTSETARMKGYVQQYSQLFRAVDFTKEKEDTEAILREAITRSQRNNRQVSFEALFSWDPGKAWTSIHPGLMAEAFFRLMNVTARLPKGGADVRIHGKIKDDHIIVTTTHPGLSAVTPNEMDLFEPFDSTGQLSDLFAIRTIVEAHGGDFAIRETSEGEVALEISLPPAGK